MNATVLSKINATYGVTEKDGGVSLRVGENEITPVQMERLVGSRSFQMHKQNGYVTIVETASSAGDDKAQKKPKK